MTKQAVILVVVLSLQACSLSGRKPVVIMQSIPQISAADRACFDDTTPPPVAGTKAEIEKTIIRLVASERRKNGCGRRLIDLIDSTTEAQY